MVETVLDALAACFRLLFYFADWFADGKERRIEIACYEIKGIAPVARVIIFRTRSKLSQLLR
jgi:hypothetical protein